MPSRSAPGRCLAKVIAIVIAMFVHGAGVAHAAPGLPANVVTSSTPGDQVIKDYLTAAVNDLKSTDPVKQQSGRDAIVNFVAPAPQPVQPSPAFVTAYTRLVNSQLLTVANSPDMRTRLNAAVAAARIAEKIDNEQLVPVITTLLSDKSEAVVIWAMKAARVVTPRGAEGAKLLPLVVDAAKRYPSSATIAFQALTSGATTSKESIDAIFRLLDTRINAYSTGVPADPLGEMVGILRLVDNKTWQAQSPAQQQKTIQLLVNLVSVAGQRVAMNVNNEERESIASLVKLLGQSFGAIGTHTGKPAFTKKMSDMVRGVGPAMNAQQVAQVAASIETAARAEFTSITDPPKLAAAPATKPTPTTK